MTFALLPEDEPARFRVSFVCSGNICRSPMAEIVFREIARSAGYASAVSVSSAGTGDWHVGEPADRRTVAALRDVGLDGTRHRARQFETAQFENLDLVVGLDRSHERILTTWAPSQLDRTKVRLLRSFDPDRSASLDVPDPYYADAEVFATVLQMIQRACRSLFTQLEPALRQGTR